MRRLTVRAVRRGGLTLVALLVLMVAFVDVTILDPRVNVRWRDEVTADERTVLERRYGLESAQLVEETTWVYELLDRSTDNVRALVADPAVDDTAGFDRSTLEVPGRRIQLDTGRARFLIGDAPGQLFQFQSLLLFAAGVFLLWASRMAREEQRRVATVVALITVGVLAYTVPLRQAIRMGDSVTYTQSRESFELFSGVRQIRFEAHLSHAILGRLDGLFGGTPQSPSRAMELLMRGATAWFVLCAIGIAVVERWSPVVVRYLGLALLAPSALLYFGYRELGHLSLNVAAFPLLARGLRRSSLHLEASSALAGLGAALHGFGLLSLAGAGLAAVGASASRFRDQMRLVLRIAAWGVAAYLGWIALYLLVLKMPIVPGHAEAIPLRPWLVDAVGERLNVATLTAAGGRDLFFTAWVVGVPLIAVAASLRGQYRDEVRAALLYSVPAALFLVMFWPIQGLGVEMDLVFAAFPAIYALAWVCAHDSRRTVIAAAILASAHLAFWRIVIGIDFVNPRL
jgi:hypothetical protein